MIQDDTRIMSQVKSLLMSADDLGDGGGVTVEDAMQWWGRMGVHNPKQVRVFQTDWMLCTLFRKYSS